MNKIKTNNTMEKLGYKMILHRRMLNDPPSKNVKMFFSSISNEKTTYKATMKYHFISIHLAKMRSLTRTLARMWYNRISHPPRERVNTNQ